MTLSEDRTHELWQSFMPEKKFIKNTVGHDLFSMQIYDHDLEFKDFTSDTVFTKWALTEVSSFDEIPDSMQPYILNGGLYAVFDYKGLPQDFSKMFHFIFTEWMPRSGYEVDTREHFEILGEKYKNNEPDSEEEIWIPIRIKQ